MQRQKRERESEREKRGREREREKEELIKRERGVYWQSTREYSTAWLVFEKLRADFLSTSRRL
jgi:hypothetical protein